MPRGHTIEHFPHNIQFFIISAASFSFPLWSARMTFLTLIPENPAAGQVAEQEPQAIHFAMSGSISRTFSKRELSVLSKLMAELGDILKPKFIIVCLLWRGVSSMLRHGLPPAFPEPFWDRCRHLHRRCLLSASLKCHRCCSSL